MLADCLGLYVSEYIGRREEAGQTREREVNLKQERLFGKGEWKSTSREMLGWMKHKLESRLLGEISVTSDVQLTPPSWQKAK